MGFSQSWFALLLVIAAASVPRMQAATTHIVGGDLLWNVPSSTDAYSNWADSQIFTVGDTLVFNFTTGAHDVVPVTETEYDACTSANPIGSTITTGPATVSLDTAGGKYFICTVGRHCSLGQKLSIDVVSATGTDTPTTTTAPPAEAGAPVPPPSSSAPAPTTVAAVSFSIFTAVFSYFLHL